MTDARARVVWPISKTTTSAGHGRTHGAFCDKLKGERGRRGRHGGRHPFRSPHGIWGCRRRRRRRRRLAKDRQSCSRGAEAEKVWPTPTRRCLAAPPTPSAATLRSRQGRTPVLFTRTWPPRARTPKVRPQSSTSPRDQTSALVFPFFSGLCSPLSLVRSALSSKLPATTTQLGEPYSAPAFIGTRPPFVRQSAPFLVAHNHRSCQARRQVSVSVLIGMSKSPRPKSLLSPIPVRM